MENRSKIVEVAKREVGYKETPLNSNQTKYGKWFGLDGVAWCGIFCSWVYAMAGLQLPNIGYRKGFAGCMTAVTYFRKNNQIVTEPQAGDLVFFDWNGDGRFDHVGIFCEWEDRKIGRFETVEGNTSFTNQSNGGQVMQRFRTFINGRVLFARPKVNS